ncbi:hypothetical protein [Pontibacter populi]|uniref:Uncharacterized protein n=1 Tax=Pontibacter populi TaxID=890055 RepID=A0ABV1RQR2_9BACT
MTERLELSGRKYAIIAVSISILLILFVILLIRLTTNPDVVEMLIKLFQNSPFPIINGILSLFLSAYYFGKKAGYKLGRNISLGSSIGLTTALKVLVVLALSVSLTAVVQISWDEGFHPILSVYFMLRIAVPVFLLGLPFAFLMGYGFGMVLQKELKSNKISP